MSVCLAKPAEKRAFDCYSCMDFGFVYPHGSRDEIAPCPDVDCRKRREATREAARVAADKVRAEGEARAAEHAAACPGYLCCPPF